MMTIIVTNLVGVTTILAFVGGGLARLISRIDTKIEKVADNLQQFKDSSAAEHTVTLQRVTTIEERTRTWLPPSGNSHTPSSRYSPE